MAVRKTTLEVDDDVLERVRQILGTTGIKDTVDAALARIVREEAVKRHLEHLVEAGPLIDREAAWRR